MPRTKYTVEEKIRAAERYIRGEAGTAEIAADHGEHLHPHQRGYAEKGHGEHG